MPSNVEDVAIILETKNSDQTVQNFVGKLEKNCNIVLSKYKKVIGILYNGYEILVTKNNETIDTSSKLENKKYYLSLFNINKIDKQKIYGLTKKLMIVYTQNLVLKIYIIE